MFPHDPPAKEQNWALGREENGILTRLKQCYLFFPVPPLRLVSQRMCAYDQFYWLHSEASILQSCLGPLKKIIFRKCSVACSHTADVKQQLKLYNIISWWCSTINAISSSLPSLVHEQPVLAFKSAPAAFSPEKSPSEEVRKSASFSSSPDLCHTDYRAVRAFVLNILNRICTRTFQYFLRTPLLGLMHESRGRAGRSSEWLAFCTLPLFAFIHGFSFPVPLRSIIPVNLH